MPPGKRINKDSKDPATGKEAHAQEMMRLMSRTMQQDETQQLVDLAELRALQTVGTRRRRRWLNERALRDLSGPLTAEDMHALWAPPPFGVIKESPLQQLRDNKAAFAIWDSGFRSIDHDRQQRVLEVWAEHNKNLKSKREGQGRVPEESEIGEEPFTKPSDPQLTSCIAALSKWGKIAQPGRAALRKAHVQSVLSLELRVMEVQEEEEIEVDNAFGRLLVHSLSSFHGLHSVTRKDKASVTVRRSHQANQRSLDAPSIMCCDILGCLEELSKGIDSLSPGLLSGYIESQGLASGS
jgi:hypothetical protein